MVKVSRLPRKIQAKKKNNSSGKRSTRRPDAYSFRASAVEQKPKKIRSEFARKLCNRIAQESRMLADYAGAIAKEALIGENGVNIGSTTVMFISGGMVLAVSAGIIPAGIAATVGLVGIGGFLIEGVKTIGNAVGPAIVKQREKQKELGNKANVLEMADEALKAIGKTITQEKAIKRHFHERMEAMTTTTYDAEMMNDKRRAKIYRRQKEIAELRKARGRNTDINVILSVKENRQRAGESLLKFTP